MLDLDALGGELVDQRQQAVEGVEEGRQASQLRTDMAVDTDHLQVRQGGGAGVNGRRLLDVDAELVFLQAGGNVRVGAGIHVRVDPQRDGRGLAQLGGDQLQALQLVHRLDVKAV